MADPKKDLEPDIDLDDEDEEPSLPAMEEAAELGAEEPPLAAGPASPRASGPKAERDLGTVRLRIGCRVTQPRAGIRRWGSAGRARVPPSGHGPRQGITTTRPTSTS